MLTSSRGINSYLVDLKTSVFDEIAFESEDVKCKIHAKDIEENLVTPYTEYVAEQFSPQ
jgi:hypothetical protein